MPSGIRAGPVFLRLPFASGRCRALRRVAALSRNRLTFARRLVSRMTDFVSETPQHSFFPKKSVPGCCVFGKVALPLQRFSAHEDPFRVERFF